MQVNDVLDEWTSLTPARKLEAFQRLTTRVINLATINGVDGIEDFLYEVIDHANYLAQYDYFGTEGLDI